MNSLEEFSTSTNNSFLDLKKPNMTRVFDYLSGGVTHFEVDRQAAEKLLVQFPIMRTLVRLGKAFRQEAVKQLYQDGFEQFLDLGSSIPSELGIHTFAPAANVIYTDINPVAVSYGNSLFSKLHNVSYIYCDVRQIEQHLTQLSAGKMIDKSRKLAIGFNFLALYLTLEEFHLLAQKLYDFVPQGSKIFQILYPRTIPASDASYAFFQSLLKKFDFDLQLHRMEDFIEVMTPWTPSQIDPVMHYLGLNNVAPSFAIQEGLNLEYTAAFFEKS